MGTANAFLRLTWSLFSFLGNGSISLEELQEGLTHLHLESKAVNVEELFVKIHHQLKGEITFDEFEEVFGIFLNLNNVCVYVS